MHYTTLPNRDSHSIYIDESDREEILGQPKNGVFQCIGLVFAYLFWLITLPVCWCCSFKIIPQYERVIVFRLGRLIPIKGPGLIFVIPCIDRIKRVDMRMRAFKVPPQDIVTADRGLLKIGADVQYRIIDPLATHTLVQDTNHTLRVSAQTALNSTLCHEKINDIVSDKHYLQLKIQAHMNKVVNEWGIEVARFELVHATVLKGAGGSDPNSSSEHGGHAAIVDLIKSFANNPSSFHMPGPMPFGLQLPNSMSPAMPSVPQSTTSTTEAVQQPPLLTPDELFCLVKGIINDELCTKVSAIFEFYVTNHTETKVWTINLKNAPGFIKNSCHDGIVDVKFTLTEEDFQNIFYGKVTATDAYMNGKLEIDGSIQTALRLEHLIKKMRGK